MYNIPFLFKEKSRKIFYVGIFTILFDFRVCIKYKFMKFLIKSDITVTLNIINNLSFLILYTKP